MALGTLLTLGSLGWGFASWLRVTADSLRTARSVLTNGLIGDWAQSVVYAAGLILGAASTIIAWNAFRRGELVRGWRLVPAFLTGVLGLFVAFPASLVIFIGRDWVPLVLLPLGLIVMFGAIRANTEDDLREHRDREPSLAEGFRKGFSDWP